MRHRLLPLACLAVLALLLPARAEVIETTVTYPVRGTSGAALYAAIGHSGPKLGKTRAIAHTGFRLTWRRDYRPRGTDCVLAAAVPKLVITTTLPKPVDPLPPAVKASWDRFLQGMIAHEKVHAEFIRALARDIEKATVGLAVSNDPGCRKIRASLPALLKPISDAERRQHRDYDAREMRPGGPVEQLILDLVNGP